MSTLYSRQTKNGYEFYHQCKSGHHPNMYCSRYRHTTCICSGCNFSFPSIFLLGGELFTVKVFNMPNVIQFGAYAGMLNGVQFRYFNFTSIHF